MSATAVFSLDTLLSALVHGVALIFVFSAFGSLLFLVLLLPGAATEMRSAAWVRAAHRSIQLARGSLVLAVLGEGGWLVLESAVLTGTGDASIGAAIPVVLWRTEFGRLVLAQTIVLIGALCMLGWRPHGVRTALATALAGFAVLLEAWHLHAAAMDPGPSFFLACEAVHVLAASAWLGSLLPLALFIRSAPPRASVAVALRYSVFAKPLVVAMVVTAFWQGVVLVGGFPALFQTTYGAVVLIKIALFAILVGFALRHRYGMVPALADADRAVVGRALAASVAVETAFGIAIVLAAAVLASLAPPAMAAMAMH